MRRAWFDQTAIGRRLQEARGARSQREIGELLGFLQPQISRYEHGEVPGSFRLLAGLAALLDVDVNWVLTGRKAATGERGAGASRKGQLEDLRAVVLAALREFAEAEPARERARSRGSRTGGLETVSRLLPADLETSWDGVQIQLPLLVFALLGSPRPGRVEPAAERGEVANGRRRAGASDQPSASLDSGAPSRPAAIPERATSPGGGPDPAAPESLLGDLRTAVEADDPKGAVERILLAARFLDQRAASPVMYERLRFLLIWAWLLARARAEQDPGLAELAGWTLFRLARATRKAGALDQAESLYREAMADALAAGREELLARCHAGLGNLYFTRGDFELAREQYVALLETALRVGHKGLLFRAYLDLSLYYHEHARDYEKAAGYAAAGLEFARRERDPEHVGLFLNELGLNAMELGDPTAAEARFEEALRSGAEIGSPLLLTVVAINKGELRLRFGEYAEAERILERARSMAADAGLLWAESQADILLAGVDRARGSIVRALERLERVQDRCAAHGLKHERDRARALAHEILGGFGRPQAASA